MLKIEDDKIIAEEITAKQTLATEGQLFVGRGGLNNAFAVTTTDDAWTDLIVADVPVGLSENLLTQLVARGPNGAGMTITYNALVSSDADALTFTPDDVMNDGKVIRRGDSTEWAFRIVVAPDVTPGSNPPSRNLKAQVRGEVGKTIRWVMLNNIALAIDGEV